MTGKSNKPNLTDMLDAASKGQDVSNPEPEVEVVKLQAGEVLFERKYEHIPVNTPLPNGTEISMPYVTSNKDEIKYLTEFAEHCGLVEITKG